MPQGFSVDLRAKSIALVIPSKITSFMGFVKGQDSAASGLLHLVLDASPNKDSITPATSESDDVAIVQGHFAQKEKMRAS